MRHVLRWPKTPERSVVGTEASEQHHLRASLLVLEIPSPRLASQRCTGLALPVNELGTNGVIAIPSCRREGARRLVEREREDVRLAALIPTNALAPLRRLGS